MIINRETANKMINNGDVVIEGIVWKTEGKHTGEPFLILTSQKTYTTYHTSATPEECSNQSIIDGEQLS